MNDSIRIVDSQSGAQADIAPQLGFNCYAFQALIDGLPVSVIDSPADVLSGQLRPSSFGIPLLFPFPNRIRAGRFTWEGKDYQVPLAPGKPNAIHGFCLDRPWRITDRSTDSVTGTFQLSVDDPQRRHCWPADFLLEVRYRVADNRLECQFRISNPDSVPLPWGLGTHAYFRLPLGADSTPGQCIFSVPVAEEWELEESLPTGRRFAADRALAEGITYGERTLDNVFTGWESDGGTLRCGIVDEHAGIELVQICDSQLFREAVVFTPPNRPAVCLEPYTCVTDAINLQAQDLDTGLNILPPGGVVQTWTAIQVHRVTA